MDKAAEYSISFWTWLSQTQHRDITYITQNQEQCVAPSSRKRCEISWVDKLVRSFYFLKNQLTKKTLEQVTNSRTLLLCFCIWIWGGTAKRSGHYLVESISITSKFYYRLVCPFKGLTSPSSTLLHSCQTKPNYNKWFKENASFRLLKHINKVENYLLEGPLSLGRITKRLTLQKLTLGTSRLRFIWSTIQPSLFQW